jgi:succinoglycan biosynthesis protein ExoM
MEPIIMDIDICLCTYRRPHVAETLRSISRLNLKPDWKIRVIVTDNDDGPSAQALVERVARESALTLTYLHAPVRNISIARNACLDVATAPLVAFIDDDEIASPTWLIALVNALGDNNADTALGPVQAIYGPECPDWIRLIDACSTKPVWVKGKIITGYTCNVLFRRSAPAFQGLRFRKEFGLTGGEDTVFFTEAHNAGAKITYAPDGIITEDVPADRAQLSWLMKRRFRSGQTHARLLLDKTNTRMVARLKNIALALAKILFCLGMALLSMARIDRAGYWFLRGTMHAGVLAGLLGMHTLEPYK